MPPKKQYRKKRKVYRKKRSMIARPLSLGPRFPPSLIAKHKFVASGTLQQPANVTTMTGTAKKEWRINSLKDPDMDVGPGASLPVDFVNEMSRHYNTYRVLGAKAYIKFVNLCSEPIQIFTHIGNQQVADGANLTSKDWKQLPRSKNAMLHAVSTGEKSVRLLNVNYSPELVEGKKKGSYRNNPDFEALSSQDPEEQHFLSIGATQLNTTFNQSALNCHYEITILYTALWNDRKNNYPESGQ